jgi:hypothetical protein
MCYDFSISACYHTKCENTLPMMQCIHTTTLFAVHIPTSISTGSCMLAGSTLVVYVGQMCPVKFTQSELSYANITW